MAEEKKVTKDDIFNELLEVYRGEARTSRMKDAGRGNAYGRELGIIDSSVERFKKRYEAAEVGAPAEEEGEEG